MANSNLIQFLAYAAMMSSSIFIPLLAESFGASPGLVGVIVGAYNGFFLLTSYLFGLLADKYGGRYILKIGLVLAAVRFAAQILAHDIFSLLMVRSLAGMTAGIFPAALTVYAYREQSGKLGRFAGFGSLGWAIGALLAGLITQSQLIFAASSFFFLCAFIVSLRLKHGVHEPKKVNIVPWNLVRRNARIYIPYFFRALGAQAIWSIFPLYLVFIGENKLLVGLTYFTNLFAQFVIMPYVEKRHNLYLINIGLLCSALTFLGYALFPHVAVVLFLQLLLAFSFSTLIVGSQQELLGQNVEQSTAMSIFNSITNFTAVLGPFAAGAIAQVYGYGGVMWAGAAVAFIGLISFTTVLE